MDAANMSATAKKSKKVGSTKKTASTEGHLSFAQMVTTAILEQKERRGSSLDAIKKFVHQKFAVVPTEATSGLVRRAIKKLQGDGAIISGAPAGRKGSGSFKLAPEEKTRLAKGPMIKAKKSATPAMKQVILIVCLLNPMTIISFR